MVGVGVVVGQEHVCDGVLTLIRTSCHLEGVGLVSVSRVCLDTGSRGTGHNCCGGRTDIRVNGYDWGHRYD